MKFILITFSFLTTLFSYCQNIDEILLIRNQKTDSLNFELNRKGIHNKVVIYLQNAKKTLDIFIDRIKRLENFNNEKILVILYKPLFEYFEAFNFENNGKIINNLRKDFEEKDDLINYYKITEALLLTKLIDKQFTALIENTVKEIEDIENYIKKT